MLWRVGRQIQRRYISDKAPKITIGGISAQLRAPKNPELVPRGYADYLSQVKFDLRIFKLIFCCSSLRLIGPDLIFWAIFI